MTIVGNKEDLIAQNGDAAVGAKFCIANHPCAGRARILPNRISVERIDGEYLVRSGYIHYAVGFERRGFEAKVLDGKNPFQLQRGHIRGVDLCQGAVTIGGVISVISQPVTRPRRPPGDFPCGLGGDGWPDNNSHIQTTQVLGERSAVGCRKIGEGRHAAGDVALLEERAQLLGRLPGYPFIHGKARRFGRAACILAVAARAVLLK